MSIQFEGSCQTDHLSTTLSSEYGRRCRGLDPTRPDPPEDPDVTQRGPSAKVVHGMGFTHPTRVYERGIT